MRLHAVEIVKYKVGLFANRSFEDPNVLKAVRPIRFRGQKPYWNPDK